MSEKRTPPAPPSKKDLSDLRKALPPQYQRRAREDARQAREERRSPRN